MVKGIECAVCSRYGVVSQWETCAECVMAFQRYTNRMRWPTQHAGEAEAYAVASSWDQPVEVILYCPKNKGFVSWVLGVENGTPPVKVLYKGRSHYDVWRE